MAVLKWFSPWPVVDAAPLFSPPDHLHHQLRKSGSRQFCQCVRSVCLACFGGSPAGCSQFEDILKDAEQAVLAVSGMLMIKVRGLVAAQKPSARATDAR